MNILKRYPRSRFIFLFADSICFCIGIFTALYIRYKTNFFGSYQLDFPWHEGLLLIPPSLVFIVLFKENKLYKPVLFLSGASQILLLTKCLLYGSFFATILILLLVGGFAFHIRTVFFLYVSSSFFYLLLLRVFLLRKLFSKFSHRGFFRRKILVIGAGQAGRLFAAQIQNEPSLGFKIIGFLDDNKALHGERILNLWVLGDTSQLAEVVQREKPHEIFITINAISYEKLLSLLKICKRVHLPVHVVSDQLNILKEELNLIEYKSLSYASFAVASRKTNRVLGKAIKRLIDIIFSCLFLLVFSPVFLVLGMLVKLSSRGPVFFRSKAIGKRGKKFTMYKFRSMYQNDNSLHKKHLQDIITNPNLKAEKLKNDPRITPLGRFIRKYSLDELPQIWNVLIGDMSLVGPRPALEYEFEHYQKWHKRRFFVRPGITGLWQVYGRSKVSHDDMIILDWYYIKNYSLWLDYLILLRTIPVVFFGKGGG